MQISVIVVQVMVLHEVALTPPNKKLRLHDLSQMWALTIYCNLGSLIAKLKC